MTLSRLSWLNLERLPIIRQDEASECGLACLAMLLSYHGHQIDLSSLRKRYTVSARGSSLRQLMTAAEGLDLNVRAVRVELSDLRRLRLPALLHWDVNHFVVLKSVQRSRVVVHDPSVGKRVLTMQEASKHMTGVALETSPAHSFTAQDERSRKLKLKDLWTTLTGFNKVLAHTLALSVVLQVTILLAPFLVQVVVDDIIQQHDESLLIGVAVGFSFIYLIRVVSEALRSYVTLSGGSILSFQISQNLLRHLLRLPMSFFEKRHVGDIASRFQSIEPIKNLLATDLVEGLVDGLMATTTLAMMYLYSPRLTLVVVGITLVYGTLSLALAEPFRQRLQESILCRAKETSNFLETIRTVQAVKLFGKESDRLNHWLNRHADVVNAEFRLGKVNIGYETARGALQAIETLAVVLVAAGAVLSTELTVGMMFAFLAYKTAFVEKAVSLVEKALDLKKLSVHLQRIADVVQTPLEEPTRRGFRRFEQLPGGLEVRDLSFRYGQDEDNVFSGVNLSVQAGEALAIVGSSGCGKTTLFKLLTGLLPPSSGEIQIAPGCILHKNVLPSDYRRHIGVVMQDDQLLAGSISDNICFFDPNPSDERIRQCADLACIHDDIQSMTMGYETLVGDMGSLLSGGQKQRLFLARALYRKAAVLFVDEGTSHLDIETERRLNDNLKQLRVTRIIIAHRPDTLRLADRVYSMESGSFIDQGQPTSLQFATPVRESSVANL